MYYIGIDIGGTNIKAGIVTEDAKVLVKDKIQNPFLLSFLYYIPYAVLSAMTVPAIFFATEHIASAIAGFAIAFVLAYKNKSLVTVAASACGAVLAAELVIKYLI